jgi:ABC-type sugar transport system permease subunit/ABC-type glycerol-3-phosphate transport system substrate-binding protein
MAKTIRLLLLIFTALVVIWSFFDVGLRIGRRLAARAERPVELTVLHWGNPAEDKIVADLVSAFEAQNPKVRVIRVNAGGDFPNKIKTMMAAGTPPDVFYLRPDQFPEFAQMGLLTKLDDRFAAEPEAWREDFYPLLLDAFRYDTSTGTLGKGNLYALPKDFTTAVFYVNLDLFEKAGIDWRAIQKNGWTWDEFEAATRKVRDLNSRPEFAGREIYGTLFQLWPDTLRNLLWTEDADFFSRKPDGSPDFRDVALDTPGAQRAIDRVYRMRIVERTAFNASGIAKDGGQEFLIGNIGSTGPIGRWMIPTYKSITNFRWDVVPVPRGTTDASQIFYTGWSISSKTAWPEEAYALTRFLSGKEGQIQQARAGLAIPALKSVANSPDFLAPEGLPPHNSKAFLDAIPSARLQQLPREAAWTRILEQHVNRSIVDGSSSPAHAADEVQKWWLNELDSPLRLKQWATFPWASVLTVTAGLGTTLIALIWWKARREKLGPLDRATERTGFAFIAPWLIGFFVLTLGPMIVSLLLSFAQWTGLVPLSQASGVGLANFKQIFTRDPEFVQSIRVTIYYVVLGVPLTQLAALAVAMLMNNNLRGITAFRTIYFVPSVVSGVAMAMLWLQLFNSDYGLINATLRPILANPGPSLLVVGLALSTAAALLLVMNRRSTMAGETRLLLILVGCFAVGFVLVGAIAWLTGAAGTRPPNWFGVDSTDPTRTVNDAARWAIPGFVLMGLWGVGGGMIIYLAGLKGISASLYEAAVIDGAGPIRKFWNVTLPMLSPLVFYNFVMGIIGSFQVFTQAYTMTGAGPDNSTLFYVLNLYRHAFEFHNMGYASALAWVLFLIVLALTLVVFRGSRSLVYYEGLKN